MEIISTIFLFTCSSESERRGYSRLYIWSISMIIWLFLLLGMIAFWVGFSLSTLASPEKFIGPIILTVIFIIYTIWISIHTFVGACLAILS